MPALSTFVNATKQIDVPITGGDQTQVVRLTVRVGKWSWYELKHYSGGTLTPEDSLSFLADLIAEWDITDDQGQPLPVTVETMEQLPIWVIEQLMAGIRSAMESDRKGERSRLGDGS